MDRRGFWVSRPHYLIFAREETPVTQGPCVEPIYSKDEFPGVKFQHIIAVTPMPATPGPNEAEAALLSFLQSVTHGWNVTTLNHMNHSSIVNLSALQSVNHYFFFFHFLKNIKTQQLTLNKPTTQRKNACHEDGTSFRVPREIWRCFNTRLSSLVGQHPDMFPDLPRV